MYFLPLLLMEDRRCRFSYLLQPEKSLRKGRVAKVD